MHNEFLIILTRCLLVEINKLETTGDFRNFLKEKNGTYYLLKTLSTREDIIEYFKQILHVPLTYIDYTERKNKFVFEMEKLNEKLEQIEKQRKEEKARKSENSRGQPMFYKNDQNINANTNVVKLYFDLKESSSQELQSQNKSNINQESNCVSIKEEEKENEEIEENEDNEDNEIDFFAGCYFNENILSNKGNATNSITSTITFTQFMTEYVPDKKVSDFDKLISEANDPAIIEYLKMRKEIYINDSSLYSNDSVIDIFYSHQEPNKIFELYAKNFCIVLRLIEEIVIQLENNIDKIPTVISYLCKIIELALKKKFPKIKEYEFIPFLGTILFDKIMKPMFFMPHYFGLIDSATLLPETRYNTEIIYKVMEKFYQCELFESKIDCYYTFFNVFFIQKMNIFVNFFKKILSNTKLPEIIEKFIDPKKHNFNPNTFVYNYFEDNPSLNQKELLCVYSPNQILELIKLLNINQTELIIGDSKTCTVISKGIDLLNKSINEINATLETNAKQNVKIFKDFRITDTSSFYDRMENFLDNKIYTKPQCQDGEIILKAKKDFCSCLNDIIDLSQCPSIKKQLLNTKELLSILEIIASLSSNNLCNSIYLRWKIQSLKDNILKLPPKYKENDFSLFYSEIEKDLNSSLQNVYAYFSLMADYHETLRYLNKELNGTENILKSLRREKIFKEVVNIIEHETIRIAFGFKKTNKNNSIFIIKPKNEKQRRTKLQLCTTIQEFYEYFPNFNNFNDYKDCMFEKMSEIELIQSLQLYIRLIYQTLVQIYDEKGLNKFESFYQNEFQKNNLTKICCLDDNYALTNEEVFILNQPNKINLKEKTLLVLTQHLMDYLMEQLYTKVFPSVQTKQDIFFYEACVTLSFIKIEDIDKTATSDCSDCIIRAIECIHRFEKAYSPTEKALHLNTMLNLITNKIQFVKGKIIAPDDFLPYVWYCIIKAKPKFFCSNMEYLQLFGGKKYEYIYVNINTIQQRIDELILDEMQRERIYTATNTYNKALKKIRNKLPSIHLKRYGNKSEVNH